MANQITKIIIRNGTDTQRRTANATGIMFNLGEPAYCTDTQRLYIGNGVPGGTPVSMRNLGSVADLFGTYESTGFTEEAFNLLATQGADKGDIIYDATTRTLYSLSARSNLANAVPAASDFIKYDISTLVNSTQFFYDTDLKLNLATQGVDVTMLNSNVVDGITLIKPSAISPISVSPGSISNGVANTNLRFIAANSLYLNNTNSPASPSIVTVNPGEIVGRTLSSNLTAVGVNQLLYNANFQAYAGIIITPFTNTIRFELDSAYFKCETYLRLNKSTVFNGSLSAIGPVIIDNNTVSTAYTNGALVVKGGAGFNGNVYLNGVLNATGAATIGGALGVGGNINAGGDITAFYSSDERLKNNVRAINSPLEKLEQISGVHFEWSEKSGKTGSDYGVLAQEVEKIMPELVTTRDNGYKAVRYEKLISLLIEAVKELNKKIK